MHNWFDEALIKVRSGRGGDGCESFNVRTDRKRVPHGGNGGKGGDVWIEAASNVSGLLNFKYNQHFEAENGISGGSSQKAGHSGKDVVIFVPCGTTVINAANNLRIRDLLNPGDRVMVAKGGRGGAGNHTGRPPMPGAPGETLEVLLDLRIKADIFMIGTPGAGKSSLLSALTHATHEEKPYPFVTKMPRLGVYKSEDYSELVICELPSLIRGSHAGHGLGNRYLKHAGRGELLWLVMEPQSSFAKDLNEAFEILKDELVSFDESFLKRPFICVINKSDLIGSAKERKELEKAVKKWKATCFFVSAKTGEGLEKLIKFCQRKSYFL